MPLFAFPQLLFDGALLVLLPPLRFVRFLLPQPRHLDCFVVERQSNPAPSMSDIMTQKR
jgi:hypothetical protein